MTKNHTPTPWKEVIPYGEHTDGWLRIEFHSSSNGWCQDYVDASNEDLQFIVRSCNNHDDLVDALVIACKWLDLIDGDNKDARKQINNFYDLIIKAKGES